MWEQCSLEAQLGCENHSSLLGEFPEIYVSGIKILYVNLSFSLKQSK